MSKPIATLVYHVLLNVGSLVWFYAPSYAQSSLSVHVGQKQASYFYFNEPLTLTVSAEWLSVKLRTNTLNLAKPNASSFSLQKTLSSFGAKATSTSWRGFHLIKLSGPINPHALAQQLAQSNEIELVAPVLLSGRVRQMVTDEFIVRLAPALQTDALTRLAETHGATILRRLEEHTFLLQARAGHDGLQAANDFHQLEGIAFAQPNFIYPAQDLRASIPNDPLFESQWALHNLGQSVTVGDVNADGKRDYVSGVSGADLDAVRAWHITRGSAEIKIAVLDSGIELEHPDLQANLVAGYDAIARDSVANDDNLYGMGGHGTAAAGIIAAVADNGIGLSGLAPNCKLMPIRVFDENATDDLALAAGIRAAVDLGADVLNNSWGGGSPSAVITEAIKYARARGRNGRGCVLVFSAGNMGTGSIIYPASLAHVIAVGASNMFDEKKSAASRDGQLKWGSNYGEGLAVVAPTLVYTTDLAGNAGYSKDDYYAAFDGTSAAAPHVAGLAGLLLSLNPSLTASEVQSLIEASCDKIGRYAYDESRPNGWWNTRYGYGRINAYRALMLARGEDVLPPQISHTPQANMAANAEVKFSARITDANGVAAHNLANATNDAPSLSYRLNHGAGFAAWQFLVDPDGASNQRFDFILPQQTAGTQVEYYLAARDASANQNNTTFPRLEQHEQTDKTTTPAQCFTFFCGEIKRASWQSNAAAQTISAGNGRIVSTLEIPATFKIADVNAQVDVRHSYVSDLILVLESPRGTRVSLASRNGEGEDDYHETTFDDEAATTITAGLPPYHDAFQPEEALAQFDGESAAGLWKLLVLDRVEWDNGTLESWGLTFSFVEEAIAPTRVQETFTATPEQFRLYESYPNPFKPAHAENQTSAARATRIAFDLPAHAERTATLRVYNTLGQVVRTLSNGAISAGKNEVWWDGKDESGRFVAAGTYLYTLQAGSLVARKKLVVMR